LNLNICSWLGNIFNYIINVVFYFYFKYIYLLSVFKKLFKLSIEKLHRERDADAIIEKFKEFSNYYIEF